MISFGRFTVDLDRRQLTHGGREVHISSKAFELLVMLAGARPKVLSKKELHKRLWPTTFVAEANLSNLVAEIRQALGDRARAPLFIRTAHGQACPPDLIGHKKLWMPLRRPLKVDRTYHGRRN